MDTHKRRQLIAALVVVIIVGASLDILIAYKLFVPAPASAYEFKTGFNHPQEINDLITRNGTVVLFFIHGPHSWEEKCPPCESMKPKIADLQSQYNGTNVTFATFNVDDNATSQRIFFNYGIQSVPQVFVIRSDGASAIFKGDGKTLLDINSVASAIFKGDGQTLIDINSVKSAIEEARNPQQWSSPIPTSIPTLEPTPEHSLEPASFPMVATPTPSPTPSVSPSPSPRHNATLENEVAKHQPKAIGVSVNGYITTWWSAEWQGNDKVTISETFRADTQKWHAYSINTTLMVFPTTEDATNYLGAFDKSEYDFTTTDMSEAPTSVYNSLSPHASTFQYWNTPLSDSSIFQYDNYLIFSTETLLEQIIL